MGSRPPKPLDSFFEKLSGLLAMLPTIFKNYYIPVESFKQQLQDIDSSKRVPVRVVLPSVPQIGMQPNMSYLANQIKVIKCEDKKGNICELINGPRIETRITYAGNKKIVFYFDSLYISNNAIVGMTSRFIPSLTRTIPFKDITKVEVQDSHKRYKYV
jgi:hypothetical protein